MEKTVHGFEHHIAENIANTVASLTDVPGWDEYDKGIQPEDITPEMVHGLAKKDLERATDRYCAFWFMERLCEWIHDHMENDEAIDKALSLGKFDVPAEWQNDRAVLGSAHARYFDWNMTLSHFELVRQGK